MKKITLAAVLLGFCVSGAFAQEGLALAKAKRCLACHQVEKKMIGPAYKDVAQRYHGDAHAADHLAHKIQKGGSGVWGEIAMPPNNVTPEEAKTLAQWVLSL